MRLFKVIIIGLLFNYTLAPCYSQPPLNTYRNGELRKSNISKKVQADLLQATKTAMKATNYELRANIHLDSQLVFMVDPTFQALKARFDSKQGRYVKDVGMSTLFYHDPTIIYSPFMDSVITGLLQVDRNTLITVKSIIVHELAHYLCNREDGDQLPTEESLSEQQYYYQPFEQIAWKVQSYYYVKNYDIKFFNDIMKSPKSIDTKLEALIDKFFEKKIRGSQIRKLTL